MKSFLRKASSKGVTVLLIASAPRWQDDRGVLRRCGIRCPSRYRLPGPAGRGKNAFSTSTQRHYCLKLRLLQPLLVASSYPGGNRSSYAR